MKYVFCIIAVIIQIPFLYSVFRKQNKNISALRMPYVYLSVTYMALQFYLFFKYCFRLPVQDAKFMQMGILVAFISLEVLLFVGNQYIKRVDGKQGSSTAEFRNIIKELEMKRLEFDDPEKRVCIDKLSEELKYSDPNSTECVRQENKRLEELVKNLESHKDVEEIEAICTEASRVLSIRNIKNKNGKGEYINGSD